MLGRKPPGRADISSHLYIHVPFCKRKCNYCAFESAPPREGERELWLSAIARELTMRLKGRRPELTTCYIGGGTPSVLNCSQWDVLIRILDHFFDFAPDAEVTVEANPESLTAGHLLAWRDWRVTRVSLGVQSFDDTELEQLGRLHSAGQARSAIAASVAAGFAVNADFMFALPNQTFANWGRTLREAASCGLSHISLYQLTIERGTPWEHIDQSTLDDGYASYRFSQWYLPLKGYRQYEIANFARPGRESRHNMNYWREGDYLGIGPGAVSYLRGTRSKNYGSLAKYADAIKQGRLPVSFSEHLSIDRSAREAAILALRTTEGINLADFRDRYGGKNTDLVVSIMEGFPKEFWEGDGRCIRLTHRGMRVANRIWQDLV